MELTHRFAAAATLALVLALSGCATSSNDPATAAKEAAALKAGRGTATQNAAFVDAGASRSNTYPLFIPPQPATTQMTNAEKKAFQADMNARIRANQARARDVQPDASSTAMQSIAARHSRETLDAIEGQSRKKPAPAQNVQ